MLFLVLFSVQMVNGNWQYQISSIRSSFQSVFQPSWLDSGQCKSGCSMIPSHQAINPTKQSSRKLNWTVANFASRSIQSTSWNRSRCGMLELWAACWFSARLSVDFATSPETKASAAQIEIHLAGSRNNLLSLQTLCFVVFSLPDRDWHNDALIWIMMNQFNLIWWKFPWNISSSQMRFSWKAMPSWTWQNFHPPCQLVIYSR